MLSWAACLFVVPAALRPRVTEPKKRRRRDWSLLLRDQGWVCACGVEMHAFSHESEAQKKGGWVFSLLACVAFFEGPNP